MSGAQQGDGALGGHLRLRHPVVGLHDDVEGERPGPMSSLMLAVGAPAALRISATSAELYRLAGPGNRVARVGRESPADLVLKR
ncbi:hypothetical protein [Actinoplanes ianthinogenes]|uniref:hypothetical protein n=1 Tax=Actinoplanes ianthinogenes TaxID=122358 RepID=UPI00166F8350|nr:hypothetical protein [Actinoplanes ianthinogenes]